MKTDIDTGTAHGHGTGSMTEKPVGTRQRKRMAEEASATAALDFNNRFDRLESKLNQLLEASASTNALLDSAVKRIVALEGKLESTKAEMHDYGVLTETQNQRTGALEKQLKDALDRIDQLENRHRLNNLRLLNVPEGEENDLRMSSFLIKTLEKKWKVQLKEEDIERAHRVGPKRDTAEYPRAIIFKLHHYQKKLYVWKETRGRLEDCNYKVVSDMSAAVRAKRRDFWPIREQLHQIGVKTFLKYPATLHVEEGGQVITFASVETAKIELQKKYPSLK